EAVVGIQALGRLAHGALSLGLLKFWRNRADHARSHPVLKLENVFEDTIKMVCPQMAARRRIDELARDAQAVRRLADAAFEYVPHAQLAAHLLDVNRLALVREARIASDHEQPLEAR